jgi:hypothetical protein
MEPAAVLTVSVPYSAGLRELTVCGPCATAWRAEKWRWVMEYRVNLAAECNRSGQRL